jgi:hypothetical protein
MLQVVVEEVVVQQVVMLQVVEEIVVQQIVVEEVVVLQANQSAPVTLSGSQFWVPFWGVHIWTRTPIWPLELIFPGIVSVRYSS